MYVQNILISDGCYEMTANQMCAKCLRKLFTCYNINVNRKLVNETEYPSMSKWKSS